MAVQRRRRRSDSTNFSCSSRTCWCRRRWRRFCRSPANRVQGFLAAGHVCAVMGYARVRAAGRAAIGVPIVVTGFEPLDLLHGVWPRCASWRPAAPGWRTQYARAVQPRRQPARAADGRGGVRGGRPEMARASARSRGAGWGCAPSTRVRRRARFDVDELDAEEPRSAAAAWCCRDAAEAARVPGVRHALHAGASARGADGVVRGRVRGVLPLPPPEVGAAARRRADHVQLVRASSTCPVPLSTRERRAARPRRRRDRWPPLIERVFLPRSRNPRWRRSHDGARAHVGRRAAGLHHRLVRGPADSSSRAATSARWRCTAR